MLAGVCPRPLFTVYVNCTVPPPLSGVTAMVAVYVTVTFVPQDKPAIEAGVTAIVTEVTCMAAATMVVEVDVGCAGGAPPFAERTALKTSAMLPTRAITAATATRPPSRCLNEVGRESRGVGRRCWGELSVSSNTRYPPSAALPGKS